MIHRYIRIFIRNCKATVSQSRGQKSDFAKSEGEEEKKPRMKTTERDFKTQ